MECGDISFTVLCRSVGYAFEEINKVRQHNLVDKLPEVDKIWQILVNFGLKGWIANTLKGVKIVTLFPFTV